MKKFNCIFLAILFGIICFVPVFAVHGNSKKSHAVTAFSENALQNKVDILSPDNKNIVMSTASLNNSPLNIETKQMQSGYTITPTADDYGQSNISFSVNSFEAFSTKSIYMWIYFPEQLPYSLVISFSGQNAAQMKWNFSSGLLMNLIDDYGAKAIAKGWRLFELKINEATINNNLESVDGITFSNMKITYDSGIESGLTEKKEGISFYHVYMADSFSANTDVVYYQNYANYKVKDDFETLIDKAYLYDELKLNGVYDIFEYVIIGKYDLKNYSNLENYTWSIIIQDANNAHTTIKFGDAYVFENEGWYTLNIQLIENIKYDSDVVLNTSHSLYCSEFKAGSFSKSTYFFEMNTKNSITFNFVDNFVSESDITLTVGDKNLAEATYYVQDNVCYITISTKKEGSCDLTIEVKGHRTGTDQTEQSYVSTTKIFVNDSGYDTTSIVILVVIFALFCVGLAIFLVISLVKARKFSVK